jgi:hypothetical protein
MNKFVDTHELLKCAGRIGNVDKKVSNTGYELTRRETESV